ncbi:MAG: alkaline phosphatase [Balneolaceae bacterium]
MKKLSLILLIIVGINCQKVVEKVNTETFKLELTSSTNEGKLPLVPNKKIKNVIFLIGDGTGLAQITSGQYAIVGSDGYLNLQRMPITGISRTRSANNLVTDSAAGATAYSCGEKTDNYMIGYLPDGSHCKTILEIANEMGLSTGLVATSTITHATPASFAAHVKHRKMEDVIAEQYLDADVDVLLGGGLEFFIPQTEEGSSRKDDRNLVDEFSALGYDFVDNAQDLEANTSDKLLGLFALQGIDSKNRTPSLTQMTDRALDVLNKNEKGFFLMVEGSQIDWGGHANDVEYVIREMRDFDDAVKSVLDFAVQDGETLVVFTADHETGGMTMQKSKLESTEMEIYWTTGSHTGIPVVTMAYGPHAIEFSGWQENTDVGRKIAQLMGMKNFPAIIE